MGNTVVLGITVAQGNWINTGVHGYKNSNGLHGDRSSTGVVQDYRETVLVLYNSGTGVVQWYWCSTEV